ncbi:MAG: ribosomal-processing cysteine protease Prp [Corallococcus sp.]|nr:ribosomal-processing cysteine protease Prp [Corallococcus sp.]
MTDIKIVKKHGSVVEVVCKGHSGFGEEGEDIVCAGISTLVQSALLGLLQVVGINVKYTTDDGYLRFTLPDELTKEERHDADILLNSMIVSLDDFYTEYSDYINLEVK